MTRETNNGTVQATIAAAGAVLAAGLGALTAYIAGRGRREGQDSGRRIEAIDKAVNGSSGPTLREHTEAIAEAVDAATAPDVQAQRWKGHP